MTTLFFVRTSYEFITELILSRLTSTSCSATVSLDAFIESLGVSVCAKEIGSAECIESGEQDIIGETRGKLKKEKTDGKISKRRKLVRRIGKEK